MFLISETYVQASVGHLVLVLDIGNSRAFHLVSEQGLAST